MLYWTQGILFFIGINGWYCYWACSQSSFCLNCIQTSVMGQYNTKWSISLVYVLKPLTNLITAISHFHSQYYPTSLLSTELRSNLWGNIFCLHIYLRHTLKSNVAYLNELVACLGRDLFSGSRSLCVGQVTLVKDPVTASKGKMSGVIKESNVIFYLFPRIN